MSYIGINTSGGINPCITFYERMQACINKENLPNKMCAIEGLDFLECVNRRKQYALNYKIQQELHKNRILVLPTYDVENDRFVSKYQNATEVFQQKH
ncbi:unnamed protein product [Paramecium primaurelia]|uniref:NADH dehydrogenase [ubiquinone] iron-sulfur protein 5 n=5 Tax=Paramecium TaxID=5884 RepID=A0CNR0_PARTE|nr:uncharacterized protein GSPATT00008869001 [Paramecium tetraurelia]CAD8045844.1 unnamed protein product [Paramecium primaurelia]CAD8051412.1 unnamed protein product [Paramecium sonneborni]CAD8134819.1 unnamed protein product [Paramecium pentaurelia]CAD8159302.1 unnamed protein product [Paramecium octaurelia]CAD8051414.1 unnamed protein product [Paramecium sonneborni]|eukprot:XP_001439824.1 hypothetical protein (macronuclear) [Paramecium tetraurelia strain d4-2]